MEDKTLETSKPKKSKAASPAKGGTTETDTLIIAEPVKTGATAAAPSSEAKSRFNAALEEAKAGAAALRADAATRFGTVSEQAKGRGTSLMSDARAYSDQAKVKAGDLAVDAKKAACDGLTSLSQVVDDSAKQIDERFGPQYGDYARKFSRTLADTSTKLDAKSVDELGEDARQFVRNSPGTAVGIAAVLGFFAARMLGGGKKK